MRLIVKYIQKKVLVTSTGYTDVKVKPMVPKHTADKAGAHAHTHL